jgi:micrococcal nuclease
MNLENCTLDNTTPFAIQNVQLDAKVLSVYDGDTITVAADFFNCGIFLNQKVRLLGMNAPEIRTKRKKEKALGLEATDYLRRLIEGEIVTLIITDNADKYGRTSAVVMYEHININEHMVKKAYARVYGGGSRGDWFTDDEENAHIEK